ncbi:T9SS type A sorting domain-containing protein [Roseivirga pacifica]|uniref:T9SS type A sorting domain-containing protein n=1 Tax=Roseivirga pacifica TaxID=1267423 RepID=UPI0020946C86|nr:T9SS type A sorting domain-containing protein [Roseivirga pacifica]MCO6359400.1 T9SS type A sorting domain-containing protein [Roseivirga pacifica]MCO6366770.1 T9SS type A sorting domain-containing protein [Roseivirga pacifica]MCO6374426.1 T9SS type A sorting domain-containing protein [Roseivirga pacifica]MCO6379685.1 T9SS type A sorting domain-containing protein [Roseivirga pacifica]
MPRNYCTRYISSMSYALPRGVFSLMILLCSYNISISQTGINRIDTLRVSPVETTSNQTAPSDASADIVENTPYTLNFGRGHDVIVESYTIGSTVYNNFLAPDTLIIRRTDGSRFINIWYELLTDPSGQVQTLDLAPSESEDADLIYQNKVVNAGYDNILVNIDDELAGAQAETERVDIIWFTGVVTCEPNNAIFPVVERGGNDHIKVAAITSLDASGNPDGFSDLVEITKSDWPYGEGKTLTADGELTTFDNFLLLRRQTLGQDPLPLINIGTFREEAETPQEAQTVQGVAVSFTELGISASQVVYGYSIFAADVDDAIHDLTDITTFPKDTKAKVSGLDLVAGVTAAVSSDQCLTPAKGPGGYKSSLSTWLKANAEDDITASGGELTDWQDHWIGNNDFSTGSTSNPDYYANGDATNINFNATVGFYSSPSDATLTLNSPSNEDGDANSDTDIDFNSAASYTRKGINIAFRTDASDITSRQVLFEQGGVSRGIIIYVEGSDIYASAWNRTADGVGSPWNNGTNISTVSDTVNQNREYIITLEQNGNTTPGSGSITIYKNGRSIGTLSGGAGLLYADTNGVELGGSDGNTQYNDGTNSATNAFEGHISEFIYCNEPNNFTVAQRNRTESYLALKYGITLDQSIAYNYVNSKGNVIFNTTTAASAGGYLEYNSDIAGIGRDDASEFEQIKSKSENDYSVVTIERTGSFPKDNTWLIWGNDNESKDDSDSETKPSLISRRIIRTWRVAEEGESGSLTMTFDVSELNPSATVDLNDLTLLVASSDSDGDFSAAEIITPVSYDSGSGILVFEGVDLEGGEYFTLGTGFISCAPGGVSTNLSLWLNAGIGTSTKQDGNDVSTWLDRSGGGNGPEQSGNRPNYVSNSINHNPSVNFNASNSETLRGDGGFNTTGYYFVTKPKENISASTAFRPVIGFETSTSNNLGGLWLGNFTGGVDELITHAANSSSPTNSYRRAVRQSLYSDYNGTNTIVQDQTYLFGIRDNSAGTSTQVYVDGRDFSVLTGGSKVTFTDSYYNIARLGDPNASGYPQHYNGEFAEIISYSGRPTDTEHAKIQSYLAIKYGVTLSNNTDNDGTPGESIGSFTEGDYLNSSSTVIWDYSANSTYHNGVAGIGRDDGSCLEQKQSTSDYADAIVTIGNNAIAASNAANTNAFGTDNSFLIWGNDAGDTDAANVETTDVPADISERMTRVWKVQETGTVGNTSVTFDLTDLGYSTASSDFKLIVSNSSTMASGTTYGGGTFSGNTITFNNIDFSNGDFFTLGTGTSITCGPGGVETDLALWLKANEGTVGNMDGEALTSWADRSGSPLRNGANQTLGGSVPVDVQYTSQWINNNAALEFIDPESTNATYIKTSNGNTVEDDLTMVTVFRTGQTTSSDQNFELTPALVSTGTDATFADYGLGISGGKVIFNAANNSSFTVESPGTYNDHQPYIATGTRVRNGAVELYMNSSNVDSGTSADVALDGSSAFGIGNHANATVAGQFNGYISEVIVFSKALSASERQRVESYLAIKYGITKSTSENYLASDGTTEVWDFSENATYNNDIAGIGVDEGACLVQTKSKSENDDAIVTMEIASFSADNSWLVWANDNVALEGTKEEGNTEFNPEEISSRLFREWRVQENGTVGAVSITFDLSQVSGPSGIGTNNLSQLRLMVDNDGDFTSGTSYITPTSTNAAEKTATFTVDFTDGQYYTLGSAEYAALPITLVEFSANLYLRNQVKLDWTTASESNNAFFAIERSTDGRNFEVIGYVEGAGNSNSLLYYDYVDTKPASGFNFYRLKQNDTGGEFEYSKVRSVYIEAANNEIYTLFPNPSIKGEDVYIDYSVSENKEVNIKILNTAGTLFLNHQEQLSKAGGKLVISTTNLPRGMLLVRITDKSNKYKTLKLVLK